MTGWLLVSPVVWVQVVTDAGRRCECRGACGVEHGAVGARCSAAGRGRTLLAAPRDPSTPADLVALCPRELLSAWCPGCLGAARREAGTASYSAASRPVPVQRPGGDR